MKSLAVSGFCRVGLVGVALLAAAATAWSVPFQVNTQGDLVGKGSPMPPKVYEEVPLLFMVTRGDDGRTAGDGATSLFGVAFDKDGLGATLTLDPEAANPSILYLAIKAANTYVVWELSGWDPDRHDSLRVWNDLIFNNPMSANGRKAHKITHIAVYGREGSVQVADGGRMLLLLGGAVGVIVVADRRARRSRR